MPRNIAFAILAGGIAILGGGLPAGTGATQAAASKDVLAQFRDPPREFSLMPFWFWNDELKEDELLRQMDDFQAHGVYGFVIHPRIGLPRDTGWMSPKLLRFMKLAVEEARKRKMYVILYDEGMYPSGSASGQVVAHNPAHAERTWRKIDLEPGQKLRLKPGWNLVAIVDRPGGQRMAVVDRPTGGVIRGLHYLKEGRHPEEEMQPAGDILNPAATASFRHLVYDRYATKFGQYFGSTILAIFTDEPRVPGPVPGTTGILKEVNRILGYDFTPHLADLWYHDHADSARCRAEYRRAVSLRLEETYYRPLGQWCASHGVALAGHPGESMDIGVERYFQFPGQDLVWRMVEPGKKALDGPDSATAKCAASAMVHYGRRRNGNELYGAYGHNLTFDEVQWLANWCLVRGHNLLYPHAFYYSVRGPRLDERPPDVGPHAAWWPKYRPYADACRRLCWVNTDSRQVCNLAILGDVALLPTRAAKACFQHQRDFNYLEFRHLWEHTKVDAEGVHLAGMHYRAVVLDGLEYLPKEAVPLLERLAVGGRLIVFGDCPAAKSLLQNSPRPLAGEGPGVRAAGTATDSRSLIGMRQARTPQELLAAINRLIPPDVTLQPPSEAIRYRHVVKGDRHFYIFFNEESAAVTATIRLANSGKRQWLDASTGAATDAAAERPITFAPHELKLLCASEDALRNDRSGAR
jgi:hypothetical protein